MYAVIKTGGKQYRVAANDVIRIERLPGEAGDTITFEEVLFVGEGDDVKVGAPFIKGATVTGELVEQARGKKVHIFKKRRRKHYQRSAGHRQDLSVVRITDIAASGGKKSASKAKKEEAAPAGEASSEA
ncbi:50S ribosomal protein L21 [Lutibaculum baratangense]|uniref:Large ribosomal subunit protein bL21 n=1 Tax=Lutibaculum baratangense AMV1 TaxID=631454 RepID=V4RJ23_9HYPH|nr:50S ribosomal protein L21 [Lutibaculum baratangense]ESR25319.1 LSU ribosomal protein L21p [Lutibaculum baratangense AMV1]